ncbi:MAG: hypothetical protein HY936_06070, partial [Nitrosomonadales bacterium]|nr:hypothetical protein [Nitrosomonadales bacterium]
LYDPVTGKFLSADPNIQDPFNLQSYNRYSYCWGNPMVCTDPSGYFSLGGFFRAAVAVAAIYYAPALVGKAGLGASLATSLGTSVAIGNGIVGGAIIGYVAGGTVQSTITGGLSGAMFGGIGDFAGGLNKLGYTSFAEGGFGRAALHAAGGGLMSKAMGGDFASGAMAAGFAELAGPMTSGFGPIGDGVARMVVGGTASVIGGGKFENGALTAAYGYLFNKCGHNGCWTTKEERAYLNRGDAPGYYSKACSGGDLNACRFYGIATGKEPGPSAVLTKALIVNGYSFAETNSLVQSTIPLNLANDYANLLPQSEAAAAYPSAQAITRYHWTEFGKYGLPPSTFGGTPFGNSLDRLVPSGLWCALCTK